MRTSDDDEDGSREEPGTAGAGGAPDAEPEDGVGDSGDEAEEDEADEGPRITLDRYLSQRRPPTSGLWHLFIAVLMLGTLVLIVLYKDRCARAVSNVVQEVAAPGPTRPPVRIELKTGEPVRNERKTGEPVRIEPKTGEKAK